MSMLKPGKALPIVYKLAIAIGVLIVTGMGVLALVITSNQTELMRAQAQLYGQTVVGQLANVAKEPILAEDELALRVAVSGLAEGEKLRGAVVYAEDGRLLSTDGIFPQQPVTALYAQAEPMGERRFTLEWHWVDPMGHRYEVISFLAPVEYQDVTVGHALVTFSRASMVEAVRDSTRAILIATVSLTVLAVILAFFLSKRVSRPIYDLMDASKAIGEGNFDYRLTGRRRDELGTLFNAFNEMAQGLYEKSQVERVLSRYVAPSVAREVLRNLEHVELGGEHVTGTVLFADIAGFTHLSEDLSPSEVASFLNEYFGYVTRVAQLYHGTIDKFMGDCAMVVFGVPERDPDHKFNAIACAVLIRRLTERLNEIRVHQGKTPVHFRIGINTGEMLAGNMGSHDRMQYTVVGDAVNLASRILGLAARGEIIIREEQYRDPEVQRRVIARRHDRLRVRGRSAPITIYLVKDVATTYRRLMDEQLDMLLAHPVT